MGEFKGTKGKWLAFAKYSKSTFKDTFYVDTENGLRIANVKNYEDDEEASANALLISKAPEMLEMLQKLDKKLSDGFDIQTSDHLLIKQLIKEATEL